MFYPKNKEKKNWSMLDRIIDLFEEQIRRGDTRYSFRFDKNTGENVPLFNGKKVFRKGRLVNY